MELIAYSLLLAVTGFAIGFVGGMVGLVLGVVRFPVIMNVETSVSIAAGTNLGVSTLGAITAALQHYRQRNIRFRPFVILASTGAVGAFIGSFLTGYIPVAILLAVIGTIVLYESYLLLKGSRMMHENNNKRNGVNRDQICVYPKKRLIVLESIIGFGIGILGGLVGLVLGSIRMPLMISILKMEPRIAIGTNLAAASVMGIFGLIGHIINNNIDYFVIIVMGTGAMIGGYLGARYTNRFSATNIKRLIGLVLIVVGFTMLFRVFQIVTGALE